VIIIALFLKLNKLLIEIKTQVSSGYTYNLEEWNKNSEETLIITSSILVLYQQGKAETQNLDTLKRILEYIGTSPSAIDDQISYLY
jgi:hypothetical protein